MYEQHVDEAVLASKEIRLNYLAFSKIHFIRLVSHSMRVHCYYFFLPET